jgi:hypothetical protein
MVNDETIKVVDNGLSRFLFIYLFVCSLKDRMEWFRWPIERILHRCFLSFQYLYKTHSIPQILACNSRYLWKGQCS